MSIGPVRKGLIILIIAGFLMISFSVQVIQAYNRQSAYNYAYKYAYKVCSDGYFWKGEKDLVRLGLGNSVPSDGVDCAHFVSCCIGNEPNEQGGGIDVPSRTEAYGEPGAEN